MSDTLIDELIDSESYDKFFNRDIGEIIDGFYIVDSNDTDAVIVKDGRFFSLEREIEYSYGEFSGYIGLEVYEVKPSRHTTITFKRISNNLN